MIKFDKELALLDNPVRLRNGYKAIVYADISKYEDIKNLTHHTLRGFVFKDNKPTLMTSWLADGSNFIDGVGELDIVAMWED